MTDYGLSHTVALSNRLQGHPPDLHEAANGSSLVINILRNERNDPIVRDELFNRAKKLACGCEIKPRMPRGCATQCHPNNVPAATPKQFWHRTTDFFSTFFLTEISKWKLNNWYGRSKDDFFLWWKVKSIAVVMARSKPQYQFALFYCCWPIITLDFPCQCCPT